MSIAGGACGRDRRDARRVSIDGADDHRRCARSDPARGHDRDARPDLRRRGARRTRPHHVRRARRRVLAGAGCGRRDLHRHAGGDLARHDRRPQPHPVRHLRQRRLGAESAVHESQPVDRRPALHRDARRQAMSRRRRAGQTRVVRADAVRHGGGKSPLRGRQVRRAQGARRGDDQHRRARRDDVGRVLRLARALDRRRTERARLGRGADLGVVSALESQRRVRELRVGRDQGRSSSTSAKAPTRSRPASSPSSAR